MNAENHSRLPQQRAQNDAYCPIANKHDEYTAVQLMLKTSYCVIANHVREFRYGFD